MSATVTATQTLATAWTFTGPYRPERPLLLAGDRLIGFADSSIYAVNLYTGQEIADPNGFPFFVERANPQDTSPVPIVSSNGAVFFPAADENGNQVLRALRLVDGTPLPADRWASPPLGALLSLTAVDELILIVQQSANGDTTVSAVFATDGTIAWGPLVVTELTSGAVGYGDHAIFFVAGRQLFAVNTDFGDTRFPKTAGATSAYNINQQTVPLIAAGVAVCTGDHVWGFDVKTGVELWSFAPDDSFNASSAPAALSGDRRLVAVISDRNILSVLDARTGAPKWNQAVGYAGMPVIAGDRVLVVAQPQTTIAAFDLATGDHAESYALDAATAATGVSVGNGHLFVQAGNRLVAKPYALQSAACFDGKTSRIEIAADGSQFDFGSKDFTIEAWVRSGEGGEILCGYPARKATGSAGFRVNLSPEGQIRFAVTDLAGANQDLAQSLRTPATDGLWHHVAVVRRDR